MISSLRDMGYDCLGSKSAKDGSELLQAIQAVVLRGVGYECAQEVHRIRGETFVRRKS